MLWIATFFFGLVVNLAPLALGSNRPLPWAYNAVFCGLALALVGIAWFLRKERQIFFRFEIIRLPLILFGIVVVWIIIQALPTGNLFGGHPNWHLAREILGEDVSGGISVNRFATVEALMRLLTYIAVFLTAYIAARKRELAKLLVLMFLIASCIYAAYGLARMSFGLGQILWLPGNYVTSALSSTFVGKNNAATYFGIGTTCAFAFMAHEIRKVSSKEAGSSLRYRIIALVQKIGGALGFYFLAFWFLFSATLLTASRGGIIATIIAIAVVFLLLMLRTGSSGHQYRTPLMRFLAILALVTAWI